jgi:hypothetical protein
MSNSDSPDNDTPNSPDNGGASNDIDFNNLDADDAEKKLAEYRLALQQEYEETKNDESAKSNESINVVRNSEFWVIKNTEAAVSKIIDLMHNAESESVQLNAAKYITALAQLVANRAAEGENDPMSRLFRDITHATPDSNQYAPKANDS